MKRISLILIIALLILFSANSVFAGFGVSPPKVFKPNLLPGSHFEQTIYLVQSKPEKDLIAQIEMDAPEIKDWINIDRGFEFIIPAGSQQFPIKVIVDVPDDAEFKHYGGEMWVKTSPKEKGEGMVTVALGAVIAFDLTVSAQEVYGFVARGVDIGDVEEGRPVKVLITLENVGNVKNRPTKVHLDIYDQYHDKLLYSGDSTNLNYVEPFKIGKVAAKFRTKLAIGSYWGDIKVYKDENTLVESKRVFYVVKRTSIIYKIFKYWYSWVILIAVILIAAGLIFRKKIKGFLENWKIKRREIKVRKLKKKLEKLEE